MTSVQLRRREAAIFRELERRRDFSGILYRDGVPSPTLYLRQRPRVMFAFREPNMGGVPRASDMRREVSHSQFQPLLDGHREARSPSCFWNAKAGLFAHAVDSALRDRTPTVTYREFERSLAAGAWFHEVVNRFCYIQIKKVGGAGSIDAREVVRHAREHGDVLVEQVRLYEPGLIVGGGIGPASPAALLASILGADDERVAPSTGATWWLWRAPWGPVGLIQQWHPSRRGSKSDLYVDVARSVADVWRSLRLEA